MAGKKPVSAASFHKQVQKRAKNASTSAKKRAQHYAKGDKLMRQVSKTLKDIAATHPNPRAKKQAKLALKQLHEAHSAFGSAGTCADGGTFGNN